MHNKILLIEDSQEFQMIIEKIMGFKYRIEYANSLEEARSKIIAENYALILLDVMLPDGMGFDLCRELREHLEFSGTPVIFLTAKTSISDKYTGFSLGAHDYVTKPFDSTELLLRVDSTILKSQRTRYYSENIVRGPLRLQVQSMSVRVEVDKEEKQIPVTPIEFKLLLKLVQNKDVVLSRQQLLDAVWGQNVYIDDRTVDKHICTIRKKIQPYGDSIKTVSGMGYKFQF